MKANVPLNELERLKALKEYRILDTEAEAQYDDIVEIASQICGTPIAVITLIDEDRQWFKASKGLNSKETSRDLAFCSHAILNPEEVLVVENPLDDSRFSDNPYVLSEPGIKFYAGAPLVNRDGMALGTLCVVDNRANTLSNEQLSALRALSRQVMAQLELRKEFALNRIRGRQSELLMDASSEGIYGIGEDGRCTFVNSSGARMLGYKVEELLGCLMCETVHRTPHFQVAERMRSDNQLFWRKDGTAISVEYRSSPVNDAGTITGAVVLFSDISKRRAVEDALKAQSDLLIQTASLGKIGGWEIDAATRAVKWSEEVYKIHELEPSTTIDLQQGIEFYLPEDQARVGEVVEACFRNQEPFDFEMPLRTAKGRNIFVRSIGKAVVHDGKVVKLSGAFQDITERRVSEDLLQKERQLNSAILHHAGYAVIASNLDGTIHTFNPAAEEILGYKASEIIGGTPELFHDPDEVAVRAKQFSKELNRPIQPGYEMFVIKSRLGLPNEHEWTYIRKDGSKVPVLLSVTEVKNAAGEIIGYLGVAADISLQQKWRREAEAATAAKSNFLANMSHEIRTPLTSILGFTESLISNELTGPAAVEALQTVYRNGNHLLGIINDILDLSKVEAGKMVLEPLSVPLFDLISDVGNLIGIKAVERKISFDFEYIFPLPKVITTDPTRLKQILINLCNNAVKFTKHGGVKVVVSCEPDRENISFAVVDTGIGLSTEQSNNLFRPFVQGDTATTRKFGGTGLGLAISKELAERLGGQITVESTIGRGSIFTVTVSTGTITPGSMVHTLPVVIVVQAAITHEAQAVYGRILLAEDGPDNQQLISFLLKKLNVQFVIAENGAVALEEIEKGNFDLVLMDMQMPVMDGYTATKALRERGCTIPIIALTANIMSQDIERCYQAGCSDYLGKPFNRDSFFRKIGGYLGVPPKNSALPSTKNEQ